MAGVIVLSFLAALGIVLLIVCICGWLWLPADGRGYCVIYAAKPKDLRTVRAYLFLMRCGAVRLPLIVVDDAKDTVLSEALQLQLCSGDAVCIVPAALWEEQIGMERLTGVFGA